MYNVSSARNPKEPERLPILRRDVLDHPEHDGPKDGQEPERRDALAPRSRPCLRQPTADCLAGRVVAVRNIRPSGMNREKRTQIAVVDELSTSPASATSMLREGGLLQNHFQELHGQTCLHTSEEA